MVLFYKQLRHVCYYEIDKINEEVDKINFMSQVQAENEGDGE
jgi:hypothetical protein